MVLWCPTRPSRTNTTKRCPFHHRRLEYKMKQGKGWDWVLPRECTGPQQTPSSNNTREDGTHGHHQSFEHQDQSDYSLCSRRWRSSIYSTKARLGADCGSNHELFITKFRLKFKKVEKTTRLFRYDLNQILYDYTVEVTNRLKRLDLIDRVPEEL